MPSDLTFAEFSRVNKERASTWHPGFPDEDSWSIADWSNAMCGEAGEAANVVKKLRRIETSVQGAVDPNWDVLIQKLADEIGDVFAYLDLLATKCGIGLVDAAVSKFNRISEREGLPHRLRAGDGS